MKHLVSIIIPVYNIEKYLDISLSSIINQTYKNLEIILVNDGSTDNSLSICNRYCKNDKRIVVISQENAGVSVARNIGLQYSKGDFICFVDGDDYIIPNYIELLLNAIVKYNSDISSCKIAKLKHENFKEIQTYNIEPKISNTNNKDALLNMIYQKELSWEVVAKLYSRKSIYNLLFDINEKIGEDFTFSYKCLHQCNNISITDFTGYFYLLREGSATQSVFSEKHRSVLNVAKKFDSFIKGNYPDLVDCSTYFTLHSYVDLVDRLYFSENEHDNVKAYKKQIFSQILFMISNKNIRLKFKIRVLIMLLSKKLYKIIKRNIN